MTWVRTGSSRRSGRFQEIRWSGYGAAMGGVQEAREGLWLIMCEEAVSRAVGELSDWRDVAWRYRVVLFEKGEERERDRSKKRAGIPAQRVGDVIKRGGRLSETDLVRCQTRYFLDGVALGFKRFVNMNFEARREYFGPRRCDGARRMRKIRSALCTLRDLQKDAVRPCGKG